MKKLKKIGTTLAVLLILASSANLNAIDCLGAFNTQVVAHDENLITSIENCGGGLVGLFCVYVANATHELAIENATLKYEKCCLLGGSGCP